MAGLGGGGRGWRRRKAVPMPRIREPLLVKPERHMLQSLYIVMGNGSYSGGNVPRGLVPRGNNGDAHYQTQIEPERIFLLAAKSLPSRGWLEGDN